MFIATAAIVRRVKRMNNDIQVIHVLSDDPSDCCPSGCSGDEFTDTVFVPVITPGVTEIVTIVITVAVFVSNNTSVVVVVVVTK